jgi:hypothetical protein
LSTGRNKELGFTWEFKEPGVWIREGPTDWRSILKDNIGILPIIQMIMMNKVTLLEQRSRQTPVMADYILKAALANCISSSTCIRGRSKGYR